MKDIIEPKSKCGLFADIRGAHRRMRIAERAADEALANCDETVLALAEDQQFREERALAAALDAAEEMGLLEELAAYLTASYGG